MTVRPLPLLERLDEKVFLARWKQNWPHMGSLRPATHDGNTRQRQLFLTPEASVTASTPRLPRCKHMPSCHHTNLSKKMVWASRCHLHYFSRTTMTKYHQLSDFSQRNHCHAALEARSLSPGLALAVGAKQFHAFPGLQWWLAGLSTLWLVDEITPVSALSSQVPKGVCVFLKGHQWY